MRVYKKSFLERSLESARTDEATDFDYEGKSGGKRHRGKYGVAYRRKDTAGFYRQERKDRETNPLEPEYYEKLPDWLRADGMYAPLEVAKLLMYLMMPIFALLVLGSRNVSFVEKLLNWSGEYQHKAIQSTYADQVGMIRKVDEEGLPSLYGDNIPVTGSTLARRLREEAAEKERDNKKRAQEEERGSTAEYFTIMHGLREQQARDLKIRASIGEEAAEIHREAHAAGLVVKGTGVREQGNM